MALGNSLTRLRSGRYRRAVYGLAVLLGAAAVGSLTVIVSATPGRVEPAGPGTDRATADYLARLDVSRFERNGTRFTDPDLCPHRVRPALTDHDVTYHYDFRRLAAVEDRLRGVHRRTALRALFDRVTAGAETPIDRHLAVLRFLHLASFHNLIQPTTPDGQPVYDPLVLLELGEMRCGHVNRVAVDLFRAGGTPARLVQVAFHVLAEVWYDGGWHYFDADIFGNGETARLADGRVPSVVELARCPERLDRLTAYWEPGHGNRVPEVGGHYPSWFYFAAVAYERSGVAPGYIEKRATEAEEDGSRLYGWEYFAVVPDPDRPLSTDPKARRTPPPPTVTAVESRAQPGGRRVDLAWAPATGAAGYRVFVGRTSRGWNYDGPSLPGPLMKWKSGNGPWRPEMYPARYRLPPADLVRLETTAPRVSFRLPADGPAYVTVMPFDPYGEAVGRTLYPLSEELVLP